MGFKGRTIANVSAEQYQSDGQPSAMGDQIVTFALHQLEQPLNLLPQSLSKGLQQSKVAAAEAEFEATIASMVTCSPVVVDQVAQVLDSGATDHMSHDFDS